MGQITKNGVPLYLGRWYDRKTNRIRAFVPGNYVYNPLDFNSTLNHAVFQYIKKWNSLANAEQKILNLLKN